MMAGDRPKGLSECCELRLWRRLESAAAWQITNLPHSEAALSPRHSGLSPHPRLRRGQFMRDSPRIRLRRMTEGYAILAALIGLAVVTLAASVGLRYLLDLRSSHVSRHRAISAFHLAEGGIAKAQWELARGNVGYRGERGLAIGKGPGDIEVQPTGASGGYAVTATGSKASKVCMIRAHVRRLEDGSVQLCSWSQVRSGKSLPNAASAAPKSVDTR